MSGLEKVFTAYSKDGELDSRSFVKMCKESKLLGGGLTATDCDLIFTKHKRRGAARLGFEEFQEAMKAVAKKKNMSAEALEEKLQANEGPVFTGTQAEAVRFHDDKSTYTGVHAHGGPSTVDRPGKGVFSSYAPNEASASVGAVTLEDLCDRSPADIRGLNKKN